MSTSGTARGWARLGLGAAALGAIAGAAAYGARELLARQAAVARTRINHHALGEVAPDADKVWKKRYGDPVELLVLGDSIAAGLGADAPEAHARRWTGPPRRQAHRTRRTPAHRGPGRVGELPSWRDSSPGSRRATAPTSPSSWSVATT